MALWFYQLSEAYWPMERYRLDVWEGKDWHFTVGKVQTSRTPCGGDQVAFYYSPTESREPGFCGWAVVTRYDAEPSRYLYFRPVSPSDQLKMHPWWPQDMQARAALTEMVAAIRGGFDSATLYLVETPALVTQVRRGLLDW